MGLLSTHIFKKICVFLAFRFYSRRFIKILHFPSFSALVSCGNRRAAVSILALSVNYGDTSPFGRAAEQSEAERASPLPTQKSTASLTENGAFFNFFLSRCGKPGAVLVLLVGGDHDLQAAHIRLQHFGNGHGAVGPVSYTHLTLRFFKGFMIWKVRANPPPST